MADPPMPDPLTPGADEDRAIEAVAQLVVDRRLEAPAVFFLELHKPLAGLSSQAMLVGAGLLAPLLGLERFNGLQGVLADPRRYEALMQRIEAKARAADRQQGAERPGVETGGPEG
jgi:hypothetical protein